MIKFKKAGIEKHQIANIQLVKETNLSLILDLINRNGPVSRAMLAQMTGLSPTTVSSLTEVLLYNNIVIETGEGTTVTSGRKPIMLEVNPDGGYIASVEIMEAGFNCILYDLKCRAAAGEIFRTGNFSSIGADIIGTIDRMLEKRKIKPDKLLGISLGVPGLIDYKNNRVISSTVVPIDESNDFYYHIKEKFSEIAVLLENESCLCAYAEKEFGNDTGVKNLIFIDINVGIGAGIILDGRIYRGSFGMAGEIGHISIDINGPECKCGNRGCLEVTASVPVIYQKILSAIMSGSNTMIKDVIGDNYNRLDMDVIKTALDENDGLAVEITDEVALKLAFGTNNAINFFNPEVIVIGGEIIKLGNTFLEKVKSHIYSIELKPNVHKVGIRYSRLDGNAVTLGGARYALDNIFKTGGLLSN